MRAETEANLETTRIGRHRAVYVTAAVTGLLALLVGLAMVARLSTANPSTAALAQNPDPLRIASVHPVPSSTPRSSAFPSSSVISTPAVTPVSATLSSVPVTAAPDTPSSSPAPPPTTVTQPAPVTTPSILLLPAVTATVPLPDAYGAEVLEWTAPFEMQIRSEHTALLSVTAHNPTDLPATLPHPLSCTPRINEDEICTQNVQLVAPGQSVSASYTIDAHGVAPGLYTLRIEGVLTISITVT